MLISTGIKKGQEKLFQEYASQSVSNQINILVRLETMWSKGLNIQSKKENRMMTSDNEGTLANFQ